MNMRKGWRTLAAAVTAAALCGGAALAVSGDQNDPLVTLSYLNETALTQVVSQVEEKAAARQTELTKTFSDLIAQYKQESAGAGTSGGSTGAYTLVTMTSGQTMSLEVGCEVLLRVGTATVNAATSPALIDVSTGGTVNSGTSLTKNHLYMATIADRTLSATAATVRVLVRGGYSVS